MKKIWFKNYPPGVVETINPDQYSSIVDAFEQKAKEYADSPAFSNMGVKLSYAEVDQLSDYFARYLQQELELKKGDRIAIMLPNVLQYPIVLFGALRAGLIVVNVNPQYTPAELIHQLGDSEPKAIVVLANFAHVLATALEMVTVQHVIVTEIGDLLGPIKGKCINYVVKYIKHMVPKWNFSSAVLFQAVLKKGKTLDWQPVTIQGDDIAFLQYTGGTTGHAKGAVLTHRNMVSNMLQCLSWITPIILNGNDIVLGVLPFYHIFSLTVCCLSFFLLGSECLLITNPRDLDGFVKTLIKEPVTIFVGLNTLFNHLLHHPKVSQIDFSQLKLTLAGGMAVQKSVAKSWHALTGNPIIEGYGLTEASPVVAINPLNSDFHSGSIGVPVSSTEVAIRDEEGNNLSISQDGELCVRGPQVMQGYWNKPDATEKVIDTEGWLKTGDVARMNEDGFLYLVDRKKDMILVSGFNVYPNEVEDVIVSHPQVVEVAVVGVDSEETGEAVKAYIVRKSGNLTAQEVKAYCRQSLAAYKIPKLIEFREELPKSHVGKILKRTLREKT